MRAWACDGRFVLEQVTAEAAAAVAGLGFAPEGDSWVRSFPADAPYVVAAAGRFVTCADALVRQAAGSEPAPWEETLDTLLARTGGDGWWLAGSAAVAVRGGGAVSPKDLDLISDADGCVHLAAVLSDLLIEPLADGGYLGAWWFRGFDGARFECVGGVHASVDDGVPSDFGPVAASRLETVQWRGHPVRVPPLDLQLHVSERRGLEERARAIRALVPATPPPPGRGAARSAVRRRTRRT